MARYAPHGSTFSLEGNHCTCLSPLWTRVQKQHPTVPAPAAREGRDERLLRPQKDVSLRCGEGRTQEVLDTT